MEPHSGPGTACLVRPAGQPRSSSWGNSGIALTLPGPGEERGQRPRVELVEPQVAGVECDAGAPETPRNESEVARRLRAVAQEAPQSLAVELGAQPQEALPGAPVCQRPQRRRLATHYDRLRAPVAHPAEEQAPRAPRVAVYPRELRLGCLAEALERRPQMTLPPRQLPAGLSGRRLGAGHGGGAGIFPALQPRPHSPA